MLRRNRIYWNSGRSKKEKEGHMTYQESLYYIENRLTKGSVYGLSRIKELLKRLSDPHKDMSIIHVAGTNGKGSVSRMLMSILADAGYRTGIFNSPYLETKMNICA